jgi:hypothetical protein
MFFVSMVELPSSCAPHRIPANCKVPVTVPTVSSINGIEVKRYLYSYLSTVCVQYVLLCLSGKRDLRRVYADKQFFS